MIGARFVALGGAVGGDVFVGNVTLLLPKRLGTLELEVAGAGALMEGAGVEAGCTGVGIEKALAAGAGALNAFPANEVDAVETAGLKAVDASALSPVC